jgi:hypothetical protein
MNQPSEPNGDGSAPVSAGGAIGSIRSHYPAPRVICDVSCSPGVSPTYLGVRGRERDKKSLANLILSRRQLHPSKNRGPQPRHGEAVGGKRLGEGEMSNRVWYSQLFDCDGAGVMLALPYEALGAWAGADDQDYDEVLDQCVVVHFQPFGSTFGVFVGDFDGEGVHESHWMRHGDPSCLHLVVWSSWSDPNRKYLPEDKKKIALTWKRRVDPCQHWLSERLRQPGLAWRRHDQVQTLPSGVLLLLHNQSPARKARFARPHAIATCGQVVPVGLAPGPYFVETLEIDELPERDHLCALCRWIPADGG